MEPETVVSVVNGAAASRGTTTSGSSVSEAGKLGSGEPGETEGEGPRAMEVEVEVEEGQRKGKKKKKKVPGVVYLSCIPPYMPIGPIKRLLSVYGPIRRLYQRSEPSERRRRHLSGSSRIPSNTEGWVEFFDKRVAKATALALNNTQIGGKKCHLYQDSLWNIKYLSGFKWHHIHERRAYTRAVQRKRKMLEMSQVNKMTSKFMENVDQSKQVAAIVERKKKKGEELVEHIHRQFRQLRVNEVTEATPTSTSSSQMNDDLLKKILPGNQ